MATPVSPVSDDPRDYDQRVRLHGLAWADYEALLLMRGEWAGVRITYLEGEAELMSPSRTHEWIKTTLARLLETYAVERDIALDGYGSWTLKDAAVERGLEPDECYVIDNPDPQRPDLALEVVWSSGGIDKLEVYRKLGVREVWFWEEGAVRIYALEPEDHYVEIERSRLLPELDLPQLLTFLDRPTQTDAVRAYQRALRTS